MLLLTMPFYGQSQIPAGPREITGKRQQPCPEVNRSERERAQLHTSHAYIAIVAPDSELLLRITRMRDEKHGSTFS